jgi:ABC-type multidrug transport system ATPase subunit
LAALTTTRATDMLKIAGLSKTYKGGVRALDGVSLDVAPGMFGLLGPNGAGKSTLMRTIATLQDPDSGSISFDGLDVIANKTELRRQLGYLPQEFGAYPRTSPELMLGHIAALKGIHGAARREVVEQLLVRTNLWDVRRRSIDTFSGGMRQRFGIAQALIGNPKIVIVDEPTAGLDPVERRRFQNLLGEIGTGVVVILSTHIVDDVADLCPRMAIMGQGRILVEGEPQTLVAELHGRLWGRTVDKSELAAVRASHTVVSTRLVAGRHEVRVLADDAPPGMKAAEPELEDVYFAKLLDHGLAINADA